MDPLGPQDGEAGGEDHQEDNNDAEQDEGAGGEGEVFKDVLGKHPRPWRKWSTLIKVGWNSTTGWKNEH